MNIAVNHSGRSNEESKLLSSKFLECNQLEACNEEKESQHCIGPCSSASGSEESESVIQFGMFNDNACAIPASPYETQQILHTLMHQQVNDLMCLPCDNEENGWRQRLYKHSGKCEDSNNNKNHDATTSSIHDVTSLYTNTNACNYIQGITNNDGSSSSLLLISDSTTKTETTNHFIFLFATCFLLLVIYTKRLRRQVKEMEMVEHNHIHDSGGGGYSLVELVDSD